jgi:hypothetical protein
MGDPDTRPARRPTGQGDEARWRGAPAREAGVGQGGGELSTGRRSTRPPATARGKQDIFPQCLSPLEKRVRSVYHVLGGWKRGPPTGGPGPLRSVAGPWAGRAVGLSWLVPLRYRRRSSGRSMSRRRREVKDAVGHGWTIWWSWEERARCTSRLQQLLTAAMDSGRWLVGWSAEARWPGEHHRESMHRTSRADRLDGL